MVLRIGAQAFPYGPPAAKMLFEAHSGGFQALEIVLEKPNTAQNILADERSELKKAAARLDMTLLVHAPFSRIDPAGLSNTVRKAAVVELRSALKLASDIGADLITIHAPDSGKLTNRILSAYMRTFAELYRLGKGIGVRIAVENTYQSLEEFLKLIKRLPDEGRFVTFDCGHANIYSRPTAFLDGLPDSALANVHLHDNNGKKDEHLVLGEGNIHFTEILRRLLATGYDDQLILEHIRLSDFASSRRVLLDNLNDVR